MLVFGSNADWIQRFMPERDPKDLLSRTGGDLLLQQELREVETPTHKLTWFVHSAGNPLGFPKVFFSCFLNALFFLLPF